MADPLTVLGAVGSIVGIIDMVGKSIRGIQELRSEWNDADLIFLTLVTQLTALKAALRKIKEWMDEDVDLHYQLVMDLDTSISCCQMLMSKINSHLSKLHRGPNDALDFQSKIKLVLKGSSIEDLQRLIEHQTTALNLVLTACSCQTIAQQKELFEKPSTRKIIATVKEDSESLFVHRDASSIRTHITDSFSKLSMIFVFDKELFSTKVYGGVLRELFKERLRRTQDSPGHSRDSSKASIKGEHSKVSKITEAVATRPSGKPQFFDFITVTTTKILMLGLPGSGSDEMLRKWKFLASTYCATSYPSEIEVDPQAGNGTAESAALDAQPVLSGVSESTIQVPGATYNFVHIQVTNQPQMHKYIHMFEGVEVIVFVADLGSYNEILDENESPPETKLLQAMNLYESIVNATWFRKTAVILMLKNVDEFRRKIAIDPLGRYFPDYKGLSDINNATRFIYSKFNQLNRPGLLFFPHILDSPDQPSFRLFVAAVKEKGLNNMLIDSGLL